MSVTDRFSKDTGRRLAGLREWRDSFEGLPYRRYADMKARVQNPEHKYGRNWVGLELLPKEDFVAWSYSDPQYRRLYTAWIASGRDTDLSPSVDRIDRAVGYVIGNIQWLPNAEHKEKSRAEMREAARLRAEARKNGRFIVATNS